MPNRFVLVAAVLASLAAVPTARAQAIPPELQVELQTAMVVHLDTIAPDGAYTFLDPETGQLRTVYTANVHPMVVAAGGEYFVCSEFIDEDGERLTADFLVRKLGDEYRVAQTIIGNRGALQTLMAQAGQ